MTERTFKLRAKVFAFCNGKENKTACILCEVRFLKKSRSSSFTNRILLDVMCSTEALLEVIRCRCKTWNCKFCALRRVLEFKQKNKTFLKPINIYHCLFWGNFTLISYNVFIHFIFDWLLNFDHLLHTLCIFLSIWHCYFYTISIVFQNLINLKLSHKRK